MSKNANAMAAGTPAVDLGGGQLFGLCNPYPLDGRVSTHPRDARGFAPMNCFLAVEEGAAILFDAGFSVHEQALLEQVGSCLHSPDDVLSLCPIRMGEFNGACNARPIADHFHVDALYGLQERSLSWMDFRPEYRPSITEPGGGGGLRGVADRRARPGDVLSVGTAGREIEVLPGPLRLLPVTWMYDRATRTLMTADAFTWVSRENRDGPWVVTSDEPDPISLAEAEEHLFGNRFWWLPGARTDEIRSEIAAIFDSHEIETIAPGFGCVLRGRDVVERHYQMLDQILAAAPGMESIGVEAGRWRVRAAG